MINNWNECKIYITITFISQAINVGILSLECGLTGVLCIASECGGMLVGGSGRVSKGLLGANRGSYQV